MESRNIFAIFKRGRTGSSRLGQLISRHPECFCKNEILNPLPRKSANALSQDHIDEVLGAQDRRNIGFTLKPDKQPIETGFFDPARKFADRRLVVFLLEREDILAHALSMYMCRQIDARPATNRGKHAPRMQELIERGVHVPPGEIEQLIEIRNRTTAECAQFAAGYAARFGAPLVRLTYERIYFGGRPDMELLFHTLGVNEGIPVPDEGEKLLPPAQQWVTNYAEIAGLAEQSSDVEPGR
jgi:hypothetical protein